MFSLRTTSSADCSAEKDGKFYHLHLALNGHVHLKSTTPPLLPYSSVHSLHHPFESRTLSRLQCFTCNTSFSQHFPVAHHTFIASLAYWISVLIKLFLKDLSISMARFRFSTFDNICLCHFSEPPSRSSAGSCYPPNSATPLESQYYTIGLLYAFLRVLFAILYIFKFSLLNSFSSAQRADSEL